MSQTTEDPWSVFVIGIPIFIAVVWIIFSFIALLAVGNGTSPQPFHTWNNIFALLILSSIAYGSFRYFGIWDIFMDFLSGVPRSHDQPQGVTMNTEDKEGVKEPDPVPIGSVVPTTHQPPAAIIESAFTELRNLITNENYNSIELWFRKNQWIRKHKYVSDSLTLLNDIAGKATSFSLTTKQAELEHEEINAKLQEAKLRTLRATHAIEQLEKKRKTPSHTALTREQQKLEAIARLNIKKENSELAQSLVADGYDPKDVSEVIAEIQYEEQLQQYSDL